MNTWTNSVILHISSLLEEPVLLSIDDDMDDDDRISLAVRGRSTSDDICSAVIHQGEWASRALISHSRFNLTGTDGWSTPWSQDSGP